MPAGTNPPDTPAITKAGAATKAAAPLPSYGFLCPRHRVFSSAHMVPKTKGGVYTNGLNLLGKTEIAQSSNPPVLPSAEMS